MDCDVVVVGADLPALLPQRNSRMRERSVIVVDQENEKNIGGQAFWSFGGLLFAGSPEQRRLGIKDSRDLVWQDWLGSAAFDRDQDEWPRRWAEAYVDFAAGKNDPGCINRACGSFRSSAGPSGAAPWPTGTATRCRGFT